MGTLLSAVALRTKAAAFDCPDCIGNHRLMACKGQPDWAAAARDYALADMSIAELCARHGVSQTALYRRAKREGWPDRKKRAAQPGPERDGEGAEKSPAGKRSPDRRRGHGRSLAARLYAALDGKMTEFEKRLSAGGEISAADDERDARTLNILVRLFEKLSALDPQTGKTAQPAEAQAAKGIDEDADGLRRDLARRLENLHRRRDAC